MVEKGESFIEGAKRELIEETGVDFNDPELSSLLPSSPEPYYTYVTSKGTFLESIPATSISVSSY